MNTEQLITQATERVQKHQRLANHYRNLANTHESRAKLHRKILDALLNFWPKNGMPRER